MEIDNLIVQLFKLGITGISDDTRDLKKGNLFVCLKGNSTDGNKFIKEAIRLGAKAILTEDDIETFLPVIKMKNIREKLGLILSKYYDYPYRELEMIGITGTDGKTTTASFIEYLLNQKYNCCYIGTNGIRYLNHGEKSKYTTLPICSLYKTLRFVANQNIRYVSMEVSSQGLVNRRCDNVEFDIAVFTNLSHEHLDTHKTMDNYFNAKLELFNKVDEKGLVVANGDDPYSSKIIHPNKVTYGIENICDYQAINIKELIKYVQFDLITPNGILTKLKINKKERFNLYNSLAAIVVALHYRIDIELLYRSLENLPKVEGRLELLTTNEDFKVYVDFAHTPNAIKSVLSSLKDTNSRLIIVMGAAGKKDKSKRKEMGKIATEYADFVYFTAEDPRDEEVIDIINDLTRDVKKDNFDIVINRQEAIKKAITYHQRNDTIIITGKGNDNYFEEKGVIYEYSDIHTVLDILKSANI